MEDTKTALLSKQFLALEFPSFWISGVFQGRHLGLWIGLCDQFRSHTQ